MSYSEMGAPERMRNERTKKWNTAAGVKHTSHTLTRKSVTMAANGSELNDAVDKSEAKTPFRQSNFFFFLQPLRAKKK